jgi:hypothetical protein
VDGQSVEVHWVSNEQEGGHYVLANEQAAGDGSRSIAFNPWPDADGTAFFRGHDGNGARVVPLSGEYREGSQLRGYDVDAENVRLPAR